MNKEEVVKLAKECGVKQRHNNAQELWCYESELLVFANACEKIGMEKADKIADDEKVDYASTRDLGDRQGAARAEADRSGRDVGGNGDRGCGECGAGAVEVNMENVNELSGIDLDYAVADLTGMLRAFPGSKEFQLGNYSPSTNWAHGGPIISEHRICIIWEDGKPYGAVYKPLEIARRYIGNTPLEAAMRAFVASKQ